jgi:hypothetical protein
LRIGCVLDDLPADHQEQGALSRHDDQTAGALIGCPQLPHGTENRFRILVFTSRIVLFSTMGSVVERVCVEIGFGSGERGFGAVLDELGDSLFGAQDFQAGFQVLYLLSEFPSCCGIRFGFGEGLAQVVQTFFENQPPLTQVVGAVLISEELF